MRQNRLYLVCDEIMVTEDEVSGAISDSEKIRSGIRLDIDLVDLFRGSMMKRVKWIVQEIGKEGRANVPDSDERPEFVKWRYMISRYIPTSKDVNIKKDCSREFAERCKMAAVSTCYWQLYGGWRKKDLSGADRYWRREINYALDW